MSEHRAEPVGGPLIFSTDSPRFLVMFLGLWVLILALPVCNSESGRFQVSPTATRGASGLPLTSSPAPRWRAAVTAIAILAYILNKGKYHPLVRPALLDQRPRLLDGRSGDHHRCGSLVGDLAHPARWIPGHGELQLELGVARGGPVRHGLRRRAVDRARSGLPREVGGHIQELGPRGLSPRPVSSSTTRR